MKEEQKKKAPRLNDQQWVLQRKKIGQVCKIFSCCLPFETKYFDSQALSKIPKDPRGSRGKSRSQSQDNCLLSLTLQSQGMSSVSDSSLQCSSLILSLEAKGGHLLVMVHLSLKTETFKYELVSVSFMLPGMSMQTAQPTPIFPVMPRVTVEPHKRSTGAGLGESWTTSGGTLASTKPLRRTMRM